MDPNRYNAGGGVIDPYKNPVMAKPDSQSVSGSSSYTPAQVSAPAPVSYTKPVLADFPQYTSAPTQPTVISASSTSDQIKAYQKANGLVISGTISPQTKAFLAKKNSGFTSSVGPTINNNVNNAVNSAGNSLTGGQPVPLPQPTQQSGAAAPTDTTSGGILSGLSTSIAQATQMGQRAMQAQQLVYDTTLAQQNAKYANLQNTLQRDYEKASGIALENAVALNPYSQSRGASTSSNFQGKITDNYHRASAELQQQADLAQQALAAGNTKAYLEIQNAMDATISNVTRSTQEMLLSATKIAQDERQFTVEQRNKSVDDYQKALTDSPVPQASDLAKMTDEQLMMLPAVRLGLNAGFDINGIKNDLVGASYAQGAKSAKAELEVENLKSQINSRSLQDSLDVKKYNLDVSKFNNEQKQTYQATGDALLTGLQRFTAIHNTKDDYGTIWGGLQSQYQATSSNEQKLDMSKNYVLSVLAAKQPKVLEQYNKSDEIANRLDLALSEIKQGNFMTDPIKATKNSLLNRIGKGDPYYNDVKALFSGATAEERKRLFGQTLTGKENKSAEAFLPVDGVDTTATLKSKIETLKGLAELSRDKVVYQQLGIDTSSMMDNFVSQRTADLQAKRSGGNMILMTGPKGTFSVPAAQVETFKKNGYK